MVYLNKIISKDFLELFSVYESNLIQLTDVGGVDTQIFDEQLGCLSMLKKYCEETGNKKI